MIDKMPKEQVEEYVEAIYDLAGEDGSARTTEVARRLGNSPASVTEVFQRMAESGLVRYESHRGARLAPKGLKLALRVKRRHRLLEVFLSKVLGIKREKVHEQACRMEHSVSEEVADALCHVLGGPGECPHGSPIPPCGSGAESCVECSAEDEKAGKRSRGTCRDLIPLLDLEVLRKGEIAFVRGGRGIVRRLEDLGLTPGTVVTVERPAPWKGPVEVMVRGCRIVIGRAIAQRIFVRP